MILSRHSDQVRHADERREPQPGHSPRVHVQHDMTVHYKATAPSPADIVRSGNPAASAPAALKTDREHSHAIEALGSDGFFEHLSSERFSKHFHFKWSRPLSSEEGMELCIARANESGTITYPGGWKLFIGSLHEGWTIDRAHDFFLSGNIDLSSLAPRAINVGKSPDSHMKAIYITFPENQQEEAIKAMRWSYALRCWDCKAQRPYWPTVRWMTDRAWDEPLVVPSAGDVPSPQRLISGDPNTAPIAVMKGVDWLGLEAPREFSCAPSDWLGPLPAHVGDADFGLAD